MANSADFVAHCVELLAPLGAVRTRRMFGGHGVYVDDLFVAVVDDDLLYLKVDDTTRAAFEAAGSRAFSMTLDDGRVMSMAYWRAPDEALEAPHAMAPWARLAVEAALRAARTKAAKPGAKRAATRAASGTPPRAGAAARAGARRKPPTPTRG